MILAVRQLAEKKTVHSQMQPAEAHAWLLGAGAQHTHLGQVFSGLAVAGETPSWASQGYCERGKQDMEMQLLFLTTPRPKTRFENYITNNHFGHNYTVSCKFPIETGLTFLGCCCCCFANSKGK